MNSHLIKRKIVSERGQSIALIAIAMVVILAMAGLILDGGQMYFSRRDSQNASDAAALAGAQKLAGQPPGASTAPIWTTISNYASTNHVTNPNQNVVAYFLGSNNQQLEQVTSSGSLTGNETGVVVTTTISVQVGFISLVSGITQYPVVTVAAAQSGQPGGANNLMPMTVCISPYPGCLFPPYPKYPTITYLAGDGSSAGSGQFAWLTYGLTNAQCGGVGGVNVVVGLMEIPATCTAPYVPIPSWVNSGTGIHPNSNLQAALDQWLNLPFGQALWTIPLYDNFTGTGSNGQYHIVQLAEMMPAGYYFSQNQCYPNSFCYDPVNNPNPCGPANPGKNAKCVGAYFVQYSSSFGGGNAGSCFNNGTNFCGVWLIE